MKEMEYSSEMKREVLAMGRYRGIQFYILNLGFHPTAYIKIPEDHPYYQNKDINLNVHGGITYIKNNLYIGDNQNLEGWFVGWDYAHYNDYLGFQELAEIKQIYNKFTNIRANQKKWTTKEIYKEVKNAILEVKEAETKGNENNN